MKPHEEAASKAIDAVQIVSEVTATCAGNSERMLTAALLAKQAAKVLTSAAKAKTAHELGYDEDAKKHARHASFFHALILKSIPQVNS